MRGGYRGVPMKSRDDSLAAERPLRMRAMDKNDSNETLPRVNSPGSVRHFKAHVDVSMYLKTKNV